MCVDLTADSAVSLRPPASVAPSLEQTIKALLLVVRLNGPARVGMTRPT